MSKHTYRAVDFQQLGWADLRQRIDTLRHCVDEAGFRVYRIAGKRISDAKEVYMGAVGARRSWR